MSDFTGVASNLSGHYEKQQRLSMKATQAKNQRLSNKFDLTKSCIDREQKKEMKQLEKTRKDMVKFLSKIQVTTGSSVKTNDISTQRGRNPNNVHTNNWVAREANEKDNLSDYIDEVVDFNSTHTGTPSHGENRVRMEFSIPSPESRQALEFASDTIIADGASGDMHVDRNKRRDLSKENIDEEASDTGRRTKKWVKNQRKICTDQLSDQRAGPLQEEPIKRRSETFPSIHHEVAPASVSVPRQLERRHSDQHKHHSISSNMIKSAKRAVTSYDGINPRKTGPRVERFLKKKNYGLDTLEAEEKHSLHHRLLEAAWRREILARANEATKEADESTLVLRDDKWAEHLYNVKLRREMNTGATREGTAFSIDNDSEQNSSSDGRSRLVRERMLRRASLPSIAISNQNRHAKLGRKPSS